MGISDEAARLRADVPDQFRADPASAQAFQELFSSNAENTQSADQKRIIIEGQEVVIDGSATERERATLVARLESDVIEDARNAERAGTRVSRIELTGASAKEKQAANAREKARADSNARYQQLLALQAQLDALDAEIEFLDKSINNILARHLLPEEMRYLGGLPREERSEEEMRLMREKLENGEITQSEFDEFKDRWDKRAQKIETRNDVQNKFDALLPDDITPDGKTRVAEELRERLDAEVQKQGAATSEAAAESLDTPKREVVDVATEQYADEGNAAQKDGSDAFAKAFGGLGGSLATSFANDTVPDSSLRESAPTIQTDFVAASTQASSVTPDAKIELTVKPEPNGTPPTNGMG